MQPEYERNAQIFMCYCNKRTPSDSDYSIAQAVLRHTRDMLELSQEELAEESHVSEASVSRFFKRSGFHSFWNFKTQMTRFLTERRLNKTKEYLREYHEMEEKEITGLLADRAERNLNATRKNLDFEKLGRIVQKIRQAKTVYFVGDIRDVYCFYSMQMDLMSRDKTTYLYIINNNGTLNTEIPMDEHTLICLLSVNIVWYEKEMLEICRRAEEKHASVVVLAQDEQPQEMKADEYYRYGIAGTANDGYYSMPLLAEILRKLMYRDESGMHPTTFKL